MPLPIASVARRLPHLGRLGRATRWRRTRGRPRVWAHRGDSAHAPENTMRAFDQARAAGADGIELDVRFDADHNVVVFHDDDLARLTGAPGRMEQLSAAERARLRIGGEPVPLLAEVLAAFELEVDVEIKSLQVGRMGALVAATAKVIKDSGRADQILVSSFDPVALIQCHQRLPDVAIAYLFHAEQPLPLRRGWLGQWMGASLLHPEHTLCTAERVKAWHTAGLPINAWTVDDAAELTRLAGLGIDGVFTNDPAYAVGVLSAIV
ncbi:MAG TPA: glycerophosphodiester phosphodiesterase [Kofleriaceae bacterium]|jgi:glycerophosphoryl diester phosphodiesterase|nr:glycerophosphodiester phosphodiesterase [Kofleriaceae bacterium]